MRIFVTKPFARFARRELADWILAMNAEALRAACDQGTIKELEQHDPTGT